MPRLTLAKRHLSLDVEGDDDDDELDIILVNNTSCQKAVL